MPLILDHLKKAVVALNNTLAKSDDAEFMQKLDAVAQSAIKAGVIQHFKFTYELCWKLIRRWLKVNIDSTIVEGATRRKLYQLAAENKLIDDVEQWMRHHNVRLKMSRAYDPDVAERVYVAAHEFAHDAQKLLEALEARNKEVRA